METKLKWLSKVNSVVKHFFVAVHKLLLVPMNNRINRYLGHGETNSKLKDKMSSKLYNWSG